MQVQAQDYVEALQNEAASLKAELVRMEGEKRQLVSRDLLSYISDLSNRQSGALTGGMTQDVMEAMKMLTNRVLASIQDRPIVEKGRDGGMEGAKEGMREFFSSSFLIRRSTT